MKTIRILLAAVFTLHGCVSFADGVKWRGIFINDEDWSLRPWAVKHFGKEEQIGTNVYGMVFKLMKEHGLNLIWPAMHEGGYEFSSRPENFDLADKHDITVGTSHCEPMLRNNCYLSKSDKKKWSWIKNREFLEEYWREGVKRGEGHNVMYTIGMRGIHDGRMPDGKTTTEKRKILEEVFATQCAMLPEGTPKMFCPYKEVLPIFNSGLNVPKDAIIMWTNDNFGYIRRLGIQDARPGETLNFQTFKPSNFQTSPQGIYWHISYHGHPHGYIHLCTTPPAFMWYELVAKCWENGVRDVWMVNAGDVFQAEILLDAFGRFAADPEAWESDAQDRFLLAWAESHFSAADDGRRRQSTAGRITNHFAEYYNLGFNRKPEHMCVQWTTNLPASVKSSLLKRYHALLEEDLALEKAQADTRLKDDYFRLIGFQARFLAYAGIIHLEGRDKDYARSVIDPLYERWNKLDGGKWAGFWCDTIDENGGMRQPTTANRWSSQMQWPWNEPADPGKPDRRGVRRRDYVATAYRADAAEPVWLEPVKRERGTGNGEWVEVPGLGTSGRALALLPVKPGIGAGATVKYSLTGLTRLGENEDSVLQLRTPTLNHVNPVNPVKKWTLVLQFLPDFALWPGLGLSVDVRINGGEAVNVKVPGNNANLGEHDKVRNAAVQDNFVRAVVEGVSLKDGDNIVEVVARDPGVVIDKIGVLPRAK